MTKAHEGFRTSGNLTGDIVTKGQRTERNSHNFSHTPRHNQKRHATPGNRFPLVLRGFLNDLDRSVYVGDPLHTNSLRLDGKVALIGSANMDRRSFELNYENNILFCDPALADELRQRQHEHIARSQLVTAETVAAWSISRRLWNDSIATLGPVL